MTFILFSCQQHKTENNKFLNYVATIPDLELPFITDSNFDLQSKLEIDSAYSEYNSEIQGVYGKRKVNDSIYFVINLLASDIVFPELVTYTDKGKKIDELSLVNCPGGSSGYDETGSSYLHFDKNLNITITDSIETFTRDTVGVIVESSRKQRVEIHRYKVEPNGKLSQL
ncbi:MAG: hypothetical protein K0S26_507 [Bacteroidota bacterium]|nr:hypothetical protein [Bacteroidota bacterium]